MSADPVPRAIGVCGTDTGVGKTVAAAAIAAALLRHGRSVRVLKPVQTGAGQDDDAREIDRLVGSRVASCGWRLEPPLAPAVAAHLEDTQLDPPAILAWITAQRQGIDHIVVETAGGVAVEIVEGLDMAAFVALAELMAVLVCRPALGTLNHSVLSVEHLRARGVQILGVVISGQFDRGNIIHTTNATELERLTGLPILGVLDELPVSKGGPNFISRSVDRLGPQLSGTFSREAFLASLPYVSYRS